MARKQIASIREVDKVTFRLSPPYRALVAERAEIIRLAPNQFARLATMAAVDSSVLELKEQLIRIEETLIRLRVDLNRAVRD